MIYKESDESLQEQSKAVTAFQIGFLALLAAYGLAPTINKKIIKPIKKKIADNKPIYWVSERPAKSISKNEYYECDNPKEAIIKYAYVIGVKRAENGALIIPKKLAKIKEEKCVLNQGIRSKNKVTQMYSGDFSSLCNKYGVKLKVEEYEIDSKERTKVFNLAKKLYREKLKEYGFEYISKATWDDNDKDDFIEGDTNRAIIFSMDLWDISKTARTDFKDDEFQAKLNPMYNAVKSINKEKSLPSGYTLEDDGGDWDSYYVELVYNNSKNEGGILNMNTIGNLLEENSNYDYIDYTDTELEESVESEEPETFTIGDMLDEDVSYDCTDSIQELFKYKKVYIEPEVSREEAYSIAQGVFDKAFNGKYREYDYAVLKSGKYKAQFLKKEEDAMILYTFNIQEDYNRTVGTDSYGNLAVSTSNSKSDEYRKCEAIVNKVIQEANEKLLELGSFTKKGKIFNRKGCDVPYFCVYTFCGDIYLGINKEKKKINRKTGEIVSESTVEEGYDYCGF